MKISWQMLWLREAPIRDVHVTSRIWLPHKGWSLPTHPPDHSTLTLCPVRLDDAKRWIQYRADKLETAKGVLWALVRDPREGDGTHINIALAWLPEGYTMSGGEDDNPPHPRLDFHEVHDPKSEIEEFLADFSDPNTAEVPLVVPRKWKPKKPLQEHNPTAASQWHPTKNGTITPQDVGVGSKYNAWWVCPEGHTHQAPVFQKARAGEPGSHRPYSNGCPTCHKIRRSLGWGPGKNCLAARKPEVAEDWHPDNKLRSDEVGWSSQAVAKWRCKTCKHVWEASIFSRCWPSRAELSCPVCVQKLAENGDPHAKRRAGTTPSLAESLPGLAKLWHPTKNGSLTPDDVTEHTTKVIWWICSEGHEWEAPVKLNRQRCLQCRQEKSVRKAEKVRTANRLKKQRWEPLLPYWDDQNGPVPWTTRPSVLKSVTWSCPEGHVWEATGRLMSRKPLCPYCYFLKHLKNEWQGSGLPDLSKSYWWRCSCGVVWKASLAVRVGMSMDYDHGPPNCPYCSQL